MSSPRAKGLIPSRDYKIGSHILIHPEDSEYTVPETLGQFQYTTNQLSNSMGQPSCGTNGFSATQDIPHIYLTRHSITLVTKPATCPYPAPDQSSPRPVNRFKYPF